MSEELDQSAPRQLPPQSGKDSHHAVIGRVFALKQELATEKAKLQNRQENGLRFYRPHWKQHKFHISKAKGRYLRTGNRFGKSDAGTAETLAYAIGGRIWYEYNQDIKDGKKEVREKHIGSPVHPYITQNIPQRPLKILILVVDWPMVKKVFTNREGSYNTWGKIWKYLPTAMIGKITKGGRGDRIETIEVHRPEEFGGGTSTITFATIEGFKHNELSGESTDWDVIHVDEPVPEEMFNAYSRGLMDRDGCYYFTCTPLDQMWINDRFTPPGMRLIKDTGEDGISHKRLWIITGTIFDNPYRNQRGVEDFLANLSREERECRASGIPLSYSGLVYKEFIYDEHVLEEVPTGWTSFENPPLEYTIRNAWDVHNRIPQALLCVATAPNGDAYVYLEMFDNALIEPNATALCKHLRGRNVMALLIDPHAVVPSAVTGESVLDELDKYELWYDKASKDLTTGITKVSERLAEHRNGHPTIYFSPNLRQTLYEFTHYIFDIDKNQPKDKDNHMMENLYRLVLNGLDYVKPTGDTEFQSKEVTISSAEDLRSNTYHNSRSLLR